MFSLGFGCAVHEQIYVFYGTGSLFGVWYCRRVEHTPSPDFIAGMVGRALERVRFVYVPSTLLSFLHVFIYLVHMSPLMSIRALIRSCVSPL